MSVQLEVQVTGSTTAEGGYQLDWEVVNNVDMPPEVFLYTTSTDEFHGVVSSSQVSYSTDPNDTSSAYYRRDTAQLVLDTINAAQSAIENIDNALEDLVQAYEDGLDEYLGTETFTYPEQT